MGLNRILNTGFAAMDGVASVGKSKEAYNGAKNNKYDTIMGTKPIKSSYVGGANNLINGKNNSMTRELLASEELDMICKTAGLDEILQSKNKAKASVGGAMNSAKEKMLTTKNRERVHRAEKAIGKIKNSARDVGHAYNKNSDLAKINLKSGLRQTRKGAKILSSTAKLVSDGVYSTKQGFGRESAYHGAKTLKKGVKNLGKAGLRSTPALAGMAATGYGAYKALDHFEKKKKPQERNDLYPKAAGAVLAGAMLTNAAVKKDPYGAFNVVAKASKGAVTKIPKTMVKNTGPAGKILADVAGQTKKKLKPFVEKMNKPRDKKFTKKASEELDFFFQKTANKKLDMTFVKDVFKENFAKGGVEAIPYYAVPSAVSYAIGRDFKKGGQKIKNNDGDVKTVVVDIPLEKKAGVTISPKTEQMIRRGADGLGRAVIPGTASMIIGKNIMDNFSNIKKSDDAVSVSVDPNSPEGKARVIIQAKTASEDIDIMFKEAKTKGNGPETISDVLEDLHHSLNEERGHNTYAVNRNVRLAQGIRKKEKMKQ